MNQPPCFDIEYILKELETIPSKNSVLVAFLIFFPTLLLSAASSAAAVDFTATVVIVVFYLAY